MRKINYKAVIPRLEDTYYGKLLATDPEARARHDRVMAEIRESTRSEREAEAHAEHLTWEDLHVPWFSTR